MTEMARFLGAQGVWVDQVTSLRSASGRDSGDAAVTSWANVLYADNFWQRLGDGLLCLTGNRSSARTTVSCSI